MKKEITSIKDANGENVFAKDFVFVCDKTSTSGHSLRPAIILKFKKVGEYEIAQCIMINSYNNLRYIGRTSWHIIKCQNLVNEDYISRLTKAYDDWKDRV